MAINKYHPKNNFLIARKLLNKKPLFIILSVLYLVIYLSNSHILLANALELPANTISQPNISNSNLNSELDSAILAEMNKYNIIGVSAAFVKDGQVVWSNGYGWSDLEENKQATPDTIYRLASVSKTITATALMQLWEQGKFGLDDDIGDYLGYEVRNPNYPNDKITFRMLLTHTSSILDGSSEGGYNKALNSANPPLLKDLLERNGTAYSDLTWGDYRPGTNFNYSNFCAGIIACLVENISGERFDQYAINHIFKPLGMDAAYDAADIANVDNIAVLYRYSDSGSIVPVYDNYQAGETPQKKEYGLPLGNYYIGPAGAVRASVTDLAKFMIAHMNGGVYNDVRILNKDTADLMHQMQWSGNGMDGFYKKMGLIFHITDQLAGRQLVGHAGEAYGLLSDMYFDPDENCGVIFVTNGGNYSFSSNGFTDIESGVINQIFDKLTNQPS